VFTYVLKLLKLSKQSMNCYRRKQLLEKLQVSESTLTRWVHDGKFPAPMKINRVCLWDAQAVSQWLQAQKEAQK